MQGKGRGEKYVARATATAALLVATTFGSVALTGCSKTQNASTYTDPCALATPASTGAGSEGSAYAFIPDPRMASQNPDLLPTSSDLDQYRTQVTLNHLSGTGVLLGQYVAVLTNAGGGTAGGGQEGSTGQGCDEHFGAVSATNQFVYSEKDPHFQEAMAYSFGDDYQTALDAAGVDISRTPVHVVAHCVEQDNAYFALIRHPDGSSEEKVCLGDSVATPGAYYADDGYVTVHELEHATTTRNYSGTQWLGELRYDEAGAINEGISDFMAMMYLAPLVPAAPGFDQRFFSTWALGTFIPGYQDFRGATRCPDYDPAWPECGNFPSFGGKSGAVSYVYPDGINWPFTNSFFPRTMDSAIQNNPFSEEIHNNAIIVEGALWDVFQALVDSRGETQAVPLMMRLVTKAVQDLPKPDAQNLSPVTFPDLGSSLRYMAQALGLTSSELVAVTGALQERGLVGAAQLPASWASVGAGFSASPGMRIEDDSDLLKHWLTDHQLDPSEVSAQDESGINGALDPGETAVVWFDVGNLSQLTAGGVRLTVTVESPGVSFIQDLNPGWSSGTQAQTEYAKINGAGVVSRLMAATLTGNSYFQTNPNFEYAPHVADPITLLTGLWVQVDAGAAHGADIRFRVDAQPSNGPEATVYFDATIQ